MNIQPEIQKFYRTRHSYFFYGNILYVTGCLTLLTVIIFCEFPKHLLVYGGTVSMKTDHQRILPQGKDIGIWDFILSKLEAIWRFWIEIFYLMF